MCLFILCSPWKACDVEFKYVKEGMELEEKVNMEVNAVLHSVYCWKPGMNYCVKPESTVHKSTVSLQCGGVQCVFKVMVYELE